MRTYPNVTVVQRKSRGRDGVVLNTEVYDTFVGSQIVRWNRAENAVEVLYDMFDFAAPQSGRRPHSGHFTTCARARRARGARHALSRARSRMQLRPPSRISSRSLGRFANAAWNTQTVKCSGGKESEGIEYHHISSVSVGSESNILVASRDLNTVWSLAHDGSGRLWTFSSSLDSDFAFERDVDRFYQPHSATQLPNGDVMLIDDGSDRAGCTKDVTGGCFSRAICYELNKKTRTARVRWQFEVPYLLSDADVGDWDIYERDVWNEVGGSVYRLSNGNYLVAFTSVSDQEAYDRKATCFAFEVDVDSGAAIRTQLAIPTPRQDQGKQNGYRLKPWSSVSGESADSPL